MVLLNIKRGDSMQFLIETTVNEEIGKLTLDVVAIYNGCLKIQRICAEIEELANYGCMLHPDMIGLTDEQIEELKLVDNFVEICTPSGGFNLTKDPVGRRNGRQPLPSMQEILRKAVSDSLAMIDKKLVSQNKTLNQKIIKEALDLLRGAVTIVYPMQLPPHDTIRNEFQNTEDLTGTQASLEVIEPAKAQLWFAGKQMLPDKCLYDFIGKNEKCKVIVKLQKSGEGAPGREPVFSEEERKKMMLHAYRRQEELKKLEQDDEDSYLNSSWSNNMSLKSQIHGTSDIKFRLKK
ncbi:hypothetical protein PVAND_011922 [Polypedilum vanderplanki]|uniref:Cilia- and flagella-associated protein 298 n=1 Tax=Polypedilum vanderplanki TaxID=319348 RepID=A0A9J6CK18_POLVA|nr:hypothetical protein PVAND_011922 [Polypedilum vanderplanki]